MARYRVHRGATKSPEPRVRQLFLWWAANVRGRIWLFPLRRWRTRPLQRPIPRTTIANPDTRLPRRTTGNRPLVGPWALGTIARAQGRRCSFCCSSAPERLPRDGSNPVFDLLQVPCLSALVFPVARSGLESVGVGPRNATPSQPNRIYP